MRHLKITLAVIGTFQLVLGMVFLIAPARAAAALGLTPVAPGIDEIATSFHDAASLDTAG